MNFSFQFDSLQSFWQMAGHGPYVWSAYAILFVAIIGLCVQNQIRKKNVAKKVSLAKLRAS